MTFTNDASNAEELESDLTDMVVILLSFESNHYTVREGESIVIALQTSAGTPNIITVPTSLVHSYGNEKYFTLTPFTDLPLVNFGPRATRHEFTFVAHDDDVYTANKGNFGILLIKDDFQNPPVTALPDYFRLSDGVSNHDQRVIIAYVTITEDELDPDANNAATGQPSISGTAQVGQILTVEIGTIADADGVPAESEFSYQWLSEDAGVETEITGATYKTYLVPSFQEGKKLKVRVSFTDDVGYGESVTSAETAAVLPEVPGAVQNFEASARNTRVALSWDAPQPAAARRQATSIARATMTAPIGESGRTFLEAMATQTATRSLISRTTLRTRSRYAETTVVASVSNLTARPQPPSFLIRLVLLRTCKL